MSGRSARNSGRAEKPAAGGAGRLPPPRHFVVGISGASGAVYGVRLVELLAASGAEVSLTITRQGLGVLGQEMGVDLQAGELDRELCGGGGAPAGSAGDIHRSPLALLWPDPQLLGQIHYYPPHQMRAAIASGSRPTDGCIICPCSMNSLGAMAAGLSSNLLLRAAQVALKERRPLIIVPREAPLSTINLENLLRLAQAGAIILPAAPGFYHQPRTVADLVDFVVARALDLLGVPHQLRVQWQPEA